MEAIEIISQLGIVFFGIIAMILVARKNKWGFIFGLLSQPFFIISAIISHQIGLLILSIAYTFTWAYGIYTWFFKK
ncbi:MAG: nicotinamide mononucleotide transporter [archaeon]